MADWVRRTVLVGGGRKIAVREKGPVTAPAVILLHGLGTHQRSWDRTAKALEGVRAITFDHAGHGRSDPADHYSVDGFLDDLQSLIDEMNVDDGYVLAGHSIGADLALLHTSAGDRCRGVVLVDGALSITPPETDWERFSILEDRWFVKALMFVGRRIGVAPSMSMQEIRALTDDVESRRKEFGDALKSLRVPALYVIGDQPDKVPDGQLIHDRKMAAIAEISSGFDVAIEYVPSGHFVPMRQPNRLGTLIRDFYKRVFS